MMVVIGDVETELEHERERGSLNTNVRERYTDIKKNKKTGCNSSQSDMNAKYKKKHKLPIMVKLATL